MPNAVSAEEILDLQKTVLDNLYRLRGQSIYSASRYDAAMSLAYAIRDKLVQRWRKTVDTYFEADPKVVCYLSAEYLLGRQLSQNLLYTGQTEAAGKAVEGWGLDLDKLIERFAEPGLGNGGLGRLAACFLDSLATLQVPAIGYGIRYEFGIFKQSFVDGRQMEGPDDWLAFDNPWEFAQPDDMVDVGFGGRTEGYIDEGGKYRIRWEPGERVRGKPYHLLVPGFQVETVNVLRLWRARATEEFDFQLFNTGDYARAVERKVRSENISKVLYPNDETPQGKELRLKQQYFFVACSLQDIFRYFLMRKREWEELPEKIAIQLNDTHPVIAVAELMRLLVDVHGLAWERAWKITTATIASTQHTLLPEAMEKWPVWLFQKLLPRHLEIVYEINRRFLEEVAARFPGDTQRLRRMSIIEEGPEKLVRMAHLACVGSFSINGVAELQSKLLRERVLTDFASMWPGKFNNKTNGVTPRRFLRLANPKLSELFDVRVGKGWENDINRLAALEEHLDDSEFLQQWRGVKRANKERLAKWLGEHCPAKVDPSACFDVMVKRLHEYKRQLLKALHIVALYNRLRAGREAATPPRAFIFGAKAAPGYHMAKLIIQLINSIGSVVSRDPKVSGRLTVAFAPNFNVSLGELIYPAAEISEQISMAGKEASGTGNMKFALNGAVTVGTLDGANIEIRDRVGAENFFLFGLNAQQALALKQGRYRPRDYYERDEELRQAIDAIADGMFSQGDRELFRPIVDSLLYHDEYLLLADFRSYVEAQDQASSAYRDDELWTRMSVLNSARCGFFSSDRAMREYCEQIWRVKPVPVA